MLNTINVNLKTDIKTDRPTSLPIKLMSQDKNNNQFILRFTNGGESVTLDDSYTVEVLTKFTKSGTSRLTTAKVRQDYATWEFDTEYITQDEVVYNFVYVRKAGNLVVSADANCFVFSVDLSEIDRGAGKVAETYDENYEKYLDEFKENVDFEEIAQAEQARKEAEILREESYEQKVDTAIVEADVVGKVDSKVTELTPQINSLTTQLAQTRQISLKEMLKYPTGFSFPFQLQIFKNTAGDFYIKSLDLESYHPLKKSNGKTYYVSKSGLDTNNGLTPETAFLNVSKAFTMADVDTILVQAGDYGRQHLYTQNLPDRDIKIKAVNGKVKLGCYEDPADGIPWMLHSTGVYKYTRSGVISVYDTKLLNNFGNYSRYTKRNTIAEVEAEAGTWHLGADNMLYVHTLDNRQPANNQDIKIVISGWTIESTRNRSFYFEGIEFQFGGSALKLSNSKLNLLKDCAFNYAQTSNGLSVIDSDITLSQNCIAYENFADGFNYHADTWNTKQLYALEIDNIGFRNGFSGATIANNNGSTVHANCVIIRLNGLYFENFGPNCADVGPRQRTWNIGCAAYNSRQTPTAIDFLTENEMWLESCQAYGSAVNLYTQFVDAKIFVRNTVWLNGKFIKTPANLIEYTQ